MRPIDKVAQAEGWEARAQENFDALGLTDEELMAPLRGHGEDTDEEEEEDDGDRS